jgi:hypothetical protein
MHANACLVILYIARIRTSVMESILEYKITFVNKQNKSSISSLYYSVEVLG